MNKSLLALLLGFTSLGLVKGEIVYDNLNTTGATYRSFDGSNSPTSGYKHWAQKFNLTSSTSTFDWVALNLFQNNSTSNGRFSVRIMTEANLATGTILATLAANTNINSLGSSPTSTWSIGGGINLGTTLSSGSYWLVVSSSINDPNFRWAQGPTNPNGLASAGSNLNTSGGYVWDTDPTYNLGGQIAVPEPGTLLLGGGLCCKRRRRLVGGQQPA